MAVLIPNANAIQANVQSGQAPVGNYGQARNFDITEIGRQVNAKGAKIAAEVYTRRIDDEVTKAKTQMALARVDQDGAYDQDEELDTIENRWSTEMNNQLGNSASTISDPRVREAFMLSQKPAMAEGQIKMRQRVFSRRSDVEMAAADNNTATLIKAAASPNGDVQVSYDAVSTMWKNMAVQGYTTKENAAQMIRDSKVKMATNKLQTMQPQQQLDALKESWAEELPLNVREQLRIEAETRLLLGKAQAVAYKAVQDDLSPGAADDLFYEELKATPELLSEAQSQFAILKRNRLNSQAEQQSELFSTYDVQIRDGVADGSFSTTQLRNDHPTDWSDMSPGMRSNLVALETALTTSAPRTVSNRKVKGELFRLWSGGAAQRTEAKMFFFENSAELSETDYADWLGKVFGGQPESLFNTQKLVEMLTINMSDKKRARVSGRMDKWFMDYQVRNDGAAPSDEEVSKMIGEVINDYDVGLFGLSSRNKSEMTMEEAVDAYSNAKDDNQREQVLTGFTLDEEFAIKTSTLQMKNPELYDDVLSSFGDLSKVTYEAIEGRYDMLVKYRAKQRGKDKPLSIQERMKQQEQNQTSPEDRILQ